LLEEIVGLVNVKVYDKCGSEIKISAQGPKLKTLRREKIPLISGGRVEGGKNS